MEGSFSNFDSNMTRKADQAKPAWIRRRFFNSSMGEGTYGSQQAAEGVTVAAPPSSSPLPVPQPAPVEDREVEEFILPDLNLPPPGEE
nr:hypothetical protein Iba_chr02fCG4370 [Ipomoea batatas]